MQAVDTSDRGILIHEALAARAEQSDAALRGVSRLKSAALVALGLCVGGGIATYSQKQNNGPAAQTIERAAEKQGSIVADPDLEK